MGMPDWRVYWATVACACASKPECSAHILPPMTTVFGLKSASVSAHTASALSGAGVVFALGLVVPGVVYLRGLCELYLALRRSDGEAPTFP